MTDTRHSSDPPLCAAVSNSLRSSSQILSNQSDLKLILANQLEIQSLIREAIKNQSALATIQQTQARIIQNQMDIAAGISEHKTAEGKILDNQVRFQACFRASENTSLSSSVSDPLLLLLVCAVVLVSACASVVVVRAPSWPIR